MDKQVEIKEITEISLDSSSFNYFSKYLNSLLRNQLDTRGKITLTKQLASNLLASMRINQAKKIKECYGDRIWKPILLSNHLLVPRW